MLFRSVPGHEIVGRVLKVGSNVKRFKAGDLAAVGVMIDSCRTCTNCKKEMEQYCAEGMTGTYNGLERDKVTLAQGGYSSHIVTDQLFVFRVSDKLDLAGVAPLLCAGITTYSPLKFAGVKKGTKVGVIGLGGLGHMGVKFAAAFGAEVTLISTSPSKKQDAGRLGAHNFLLSTDEKQMKAYDSYFDVLLNTVSANHDYEPYLNLLNFEGRMMIVGTPKGEVLAYDGTGKEIWKAQLNSDVLSAPQVEQDIVIVRSGDGRVFGLDAATGARNWVYQRTLPALTVRTHVSVQPYRGAVFAGFPGGRLVAISASNGNLIWEATVALPKGATELERVADVTSIPVTEIGRAHV